MRRRMLVLIYVGLSLLTLAVYVRVPTFDFVGIDDPGYVLDRPEVLDGPTADGIAWAFTTTAQSNWHPLTWISLMLDARIGSGRPAVFHLTNLLIHLANTLLLFELLRRTTGNAWRSAFVAALFGVHPLHVESVAWIAERKDVLSTMFAFLAMLAYLRYVRRPGMRSYLPVPILFALGLMSKPMVLTLPLILVLLDYWPLARLGGTGAPTGTAPRSRPILDKLPLLGLAALSAWITIGAQVRHGSLIPLEARPLDERIANAIVTYVAYAVDAIWPSGLAVLYPYASEDLGPWRVGVSALLLILVSVLVVVNARRARYLLVGWAWYLVTLVPVIGLVQVGRQARADRYTYVPLIGLFLILAWGGHAMWRRVARGPTGLSGHLPAATAGACMLALAIAGHLQTLHWRDSTALFGRALAVTDRNLVAHNGLGLALFRSGRHEEATEHFRTALRYAPDYLEARFNAAAALVATGAIDEAIGHYRALLKLSPGSVEAHVHLGDALTRLGRTREAMEQYETAQRLRPGHAPALRQIGVLLLQEGRAEEAHAFLERAIRADPADAVAPLVLGSDLLKRDQVDTAVKHLGTAVRLEPQNVKARRNLGVALARQGNHAAAIEHLREALRLEPTHEGTRRNLERARALSGER